MAKNKKCWACKRILVGDSKIGLCSECLNKYGTSVAGVAGLGLSIGVRQLAKNGGKIIKMATNFVKH